MTRVAVLGLGTMGGGMAARLVDAGLPVTVWNRGAGRADPFGARGASIASSPKDAATGAAVVISMVADDRASRQVWLGPDGALAGASAGTIVIESSTVSPAWVEEWAHAAAALGCECLDAPVTGSKTQAATGQLLFLVGGSAAVLDRVRPVLAAMSRDVLHVGPIGSGARLKLVNNFVCGVQAAALAEAIAFIEASGLDREAALSVLTTGAPGSPLVKAVGARMTAPDYTVNFSLALMLKDLSYAIDEAARAGVPLSTAATARDRFAAALASGLGEADFSAVVEPLRRRASP